MINLQVHFQYNGKAKVEIVDYYDTVEEALQDARRTWNEESETGTIMSVWDGSQVLATLAKPTTDPEMCITVYGDGRIEHHRCVYVMGEDGWYDHTDITEVTPVAAA